MVVVVALSVVVALDQGTKALVIRALRPGEARSGHAFGIRIRHHRNPKLPARLKLSLNTLIACWILLAGSLPLVLQAAGSFGEAATRAGVGLVLGGSLSNLIDRAAHQAVIDFIDLRVWPVFNLADAAITLGSFLIVWSTFL